MKYHQDIHLRFQQSTVYIGLGKSRFTVVCQIQFILILLFINDVFPIQVTVSLLLLHPICYTVIEIKKIVEAMFHQNERDNQKEGNDRCQSQGTQYEERQKKLPKGEHSLAFYSG